MASLLTSDQVNYLIWRYLQEAGFRESALSFQNDSKVDKLDRFYKVDVSTGALVYLIQRGIQYEELIAKVNRDGSIKTDTKPFRYLPAAPPLLVDEDEGVGTDNGQMEDEDDDGDQDSNVFQSKESPSSSSTNAKKRIIEDGVNAARGPKKRRRRAKQENDENASSSPLTTGESSFTNGNSVGTQVEEIEEITADHLLILATDNKNVMFCAWNPVEPALLATAGLEQNAQIWEVSADTATCNAMGNIVISDGPSGSNGDKNHITAVAWSPEGNQLATGLYDGQTRIWSAEGVVEQNLKLHPGPVDVLRWNRDASFLLVQSADGQIVAWEPSTGSAHKIFQLDNETALNVEWISKTQFLVSGDHGGVYHFDMEHDAPLHSRRVHDKEVDCIKWDEILETVATAGVDSTISIWHKPSSDTNPEPKLKGHTGPVVSIDWQPNPNFIPAAPTRILASASHDCTVRLWDVCTLTCLRELKFHQDPLENICFSPDGRRLASRANSAIIIWNAESGIPTHIHDRVKSRGKNVAALQEEVNQCEGMSWDDSSTHLAIAEGGYRCTIIRVKNYSKDPAS